MDFVVYILYSEKFGKTYTGFTTDLINRMRSHNHFATKGFAYRYRPWMVAYLEWFSTKKEAMERERFLKSGKGREWVKDKLIR